MEDIGGPTVNEETPPLDAGTIASLAVQGLYQWSAKNENQLSLNKGDIIRVSRKYVIFIFLITRTSTQTLYFLGI